MRKALEGKHSNIFPSIIVDFFFVVVLLFLSYTVQETFVAGMTPTLVLHIMIRF